MLALHRVLLGEVDAGEAQTQLQRGGEHHAVAVPDVRSGRIGDELAQRQVADRSDGCERIERTLGMHADNFGGIHHEETFGAHHDEIVERCEVLCNIDWLAGLNETNDA